VGCRPMTRPFQFSVAQLFAITAITAAVLWIVPICLGNGFALMAVSLALCTSVGGILGRPFEGFMTWVFMMFAGFLGLVVVAMVFVD
jgi:hypothetical protein